MDSFYRIGPEKNLLSDKDYNAVILQPDSIGWPVINFKHYRLYMALHATKKRKDC